MTKPSTFLIHHPYQPPAGFDAPQPGVYKASTVIFPNVAAMRARDWKHKHGYTYGLHGTPTTFVLEERIASLEGGHQCVLLPSGLAAIACVNLALLKAGDEVLIPDNAYGPNKALAEGELAQWGISHQLYDAMNPADLEARIGPRTRLVWLEAPGSVTMEFPPLAHQALQAELEIGLMLPCNVIVYEGDDGKAVVAAVDPTKTMAASGLPALTALAETVKEKLARALSKLS